MPARNICPACGQEFQRPRAMRRHIELRCAKRPALRRHNSSKPAPSPPSQGVAPQQEAAPQPRSTPGLTPPDITIDVPEAAPRGRASPKPLDAVSPPRRISRARRSIIKPQLEEVIRPTSTDVGVGTHTSPHVTRGFLLCPPQVPDMHPAPLREVAYVREAILARPELNLRLCRCRTCTRHSLLARRRMGDRIDRTDTRPRVEFVNLPLNHTSESSSEERQDLRRAHERHPASVACICGCYLCIAHRHSTSPPKQLPGSAFHPGGWRMSRPATKRTAITDWPIA